MTLLRLGLIGFGRWGRTIARTVTHAGGVSLVRVATSVPERVRELGAAGAGIVATSSWHDVANATDLDGVIIAVPPRVQPTIIREAVAAGLPVLAEKPLALGVSEAEDLRAQVRAKGGLVVVDHTQLFNPSYEALRRIVRTAGRLIAIRGNAGAWGPFRPDVPVLWDWGAHDVAMCIDLLCAPPIAASATVLERRDVADGVGERIVLQLKFEGGVDARCEVTNVASERRRSLTVDLEGVTLVFEDVGRHRLLRVTAATSPEIIPTSPEPPLRRVVAAFAAAVRHGGDLSSLDLGVDVVRALAAAEASASYVAELGR